MTAKPPRGRLKPPTVRVSSNKETSGILLVFHVLQPLAGLVTGNLMKRFYLSTVTVVHALTFIGTSLRRGYFVIAREFQRNGFSHSPPACYNEEAALFSFLLHTKVSYCFKLLDNLTALYM